MGAGIRAYGEDGSLWYDSTTRLTRIYGEQILVGNNGYVDLPQLSGQGTPFAIVPYPTIQNNEHLGVSISAPMVSYQSFTGTRLNFVFPFSQWSNPTTFVFYGAY